jgi:hypothetical protein
MRVVAGSEASRAFRQAELDRHLAAMSRFVQQARETATPATCSLVLRSAASAPAHVLSLMKDSLAEAGIRARVILAMLEPETDLRKLFAALSALSPGADSAALIRWARNPRLLDAHEQVTYGTDMCWSGDAMRRDADRRNALALFDTGAPEAALRAAHGFKALWAASTTVPAHFLDARENSKPSAAYEQPTGAAVTALKTLRQGWPLVRH